ncbi:hypothetical protein E4T56_gene18137 [Termitomyces sp. T112]|nr:hypothetical protein E4T56_gene18137 [Termitomyces sp. T112]
MTSLPSFVELMASLGLDQSTKTSDHRPQSQSALSSPSTSPRLIGAGIHSRSRSTQSLRESSRSRTTRYSPYSPVIPTPRRDSLSSASSCSLQRDQSPVRAISSSPRDASPRRFSRRSTNNLSVNVYGSASDLAANTPISSYVRRKTPGASPTSPTFSHESRDSSPVSPVPMTVPKLPAFCSGSFPTTTRDIESLTFETHSAAEAAKTDRRGRRSVGTRISTPPHSADLTSHYPRRRSLAHIC